MKVDFLHKFEDFQRLTENHRIFLYQSKNDGSLVIRAGRFGFKADSTEDAETFKKAEAWARLNACYVSESLPEELIFA